MPWDEQQCVRRCREVAPGEVYQDAHTHTHTHAQEGRARPRSQGRAQPYTTGGTQGYSGSVERSRATALRNICTQQVALCSCVCCVRLGPRASPPPLKLQNCCQHTRMHVFEARPHERAAIGCGPTPPFPNIHTQTHTDTWARCARQAHGQTGRQLGGLANTWSNVGKPPYCSHPRGR